MRFNPKSVILAVMVVVATVLAVLPQASAVSMKSGSPFLYDENTGRMVGLKDSDGTESYFPRFSTQSAASSVASFTPASPGAIGGVTPAAGSFTTLSASGNVTQSGGFFRQNHGATDFYIGRSVDLVSGGVSGRTAIRLDAGGLDFAAGGTRVAGISTTGVLDIGNTVTTAAAVASTHKAQIVIGGVTYYILLTDAP